MSNRKITKTIAVATTFLIAACSSQESENTPTNITSLACTNTVADSSFDGINVNRIRSELATPNTYEETTVRTGVTMDYMVHTHPNPKALLILIAGSQLDAAIEGANGTGQQATGAGGNFLVRSAHLFAAQGYKVISIDRPSDYLDYTGGLTSGGAYDGYRTSATHFSDLQAIIAAENTSPALPVAIAGNSRGTISAVAQHDVADYVLLSAPVTSGGGSPIGSTGVLPSALGGKPVHIIWHQQDDCFVSTPTGASDISVQFSNVTAVRVSGGINHPELSTRTSNQGCDGSKTYHGFVGIESCVVTNVTDWLDAQLNM